MIWVITYIHIKWRAVFYIQYLISTFEDTTWTNGEIIICCTEKPCFLSFFTQFDPVIYVSRHRFQHTLINPATQCIANFYLGEYKIVTHICVEQHSFVVFMWHTISKIIFGVSRGCALLYLFVAMFPVNWFYLFSGWNWYIVLNTMMQIYHNWGALGRYVHFAQAHYNICRYNPVLYLPLPSDFTVTKNTCMCIWTGDLTQNWLL